MSAKYMVLPPDPQITVSDVFVRKTQGLTLIRRGLVDRIAPRIIRIRAVAADTPKETAQSKYSRFLFPSFNYAYPENLPFLDDAFQRVMRYPVQLAKDQRSNWAEWI